MEKGDLKCYTVNFHSKVLGGFRMALDQFYFTVFHYLDLQYVTSEHDHRVLHNKLELSHQIPLFIFPSIFDLSFSPILALFFTQKLIQYVSKA